MEDHAKCESMEGLANALELVHLSIFSRVEQQHSVQAPQGPLSFNFFPWCEH